MMIHEGCDINAVDGTGRYSLLVCNVLLSNSRTAQFLSVFLIPLPLYQDSISIPLKPYIYGTRVLVQNNNL